MVGTLKIIVSKDMMKATAVISNIGTQEITIELVESKMEELGIKAGLNKEAIRQLVEWEQFDKVFTIAEGQEPGQSTPGHYEFDFETDEKSNNGPVIREDGTVDYSHKIVMASEGDKLGMYIPPKAGKFGFTVYASMIAPKPQKDERLKIGKGVEIRDDVLYATESGEIQLTDTMIKIENQITIQGDAKYGTGTTDFVGNVHITGDVNSGVEINAGGNVVIDGIVEAATIKAGKDVVIRGGVHGKCKAIITAGESVFTSFVEESTVKAGKNIHVNSMVNCEATADGSVIVEGDKAKIIGGKVSAGKDIFSDFIGNEVGVQTIIEINSNDIERLPNNKVAVRRKMFPQTELYINGIQYKGDGSISGEYHLMGNVVRYYKMGTYIEKVIEEKPKEKPLIMLVDDEPIILKTFFGFIQDKYRVMIAANPKDALLQLEKTIPDLMLLDYKMPIMDGGQLLEIIRKATDKPYSHIPVIFATAMSDKDIVKKCLSLYPQGYLVKPLTKDELLDVLDRFFNESGEGDKKFIMKQ